MNHRDYKGRLSMLKMLMQTKLYDSALAFAETEFDFAQREGETYFASQFAEALAVIYSERGEHARAHRWDQYAHQLKGLTPKAKLEAEKALKGIQEIKESQPEVLPKRPRKSKAEIERDYAELERKYLKEQPEDEEEDEEDLEINEELLTQALQELEALVGLKPLKTQIKGLVNFLKLQKLRKEQGLKTAPLTNHLVFTGSPGTGKTTVARIMGKIYLALGMLRSDKVVETDREGLVGKYVGHTAVKTNQVIDRAMGGVLFIDEAYALNNSSSNDYGQEAISTLLKRMEDERGEFVVIMAGYSDEMSQLLKMNPGLSSRFTQTIDFPAFTGSELAEIFTRMAASSDYQLSAEAQAKLEALFEAHLNQRDPHFGNGRFVRNCYQETLISQANRLMQGLFADTDISLIEAEDIQTEMPQSKARMGFGV